MVSIQNWDNVMNESSRSRSLERSPRVFKFNADDLRRLISTEPYTTSRQAINTISPLSQARSLDSLEVSKPVPVDRSFSDPISLKADAKCIVTVTSSGRDQFIEAYVTFKNDSHLLKYIIKTHGLEILDISMQAEVVRIGETRYKLRSWKTATKIFNQLASINYQRRKIHL